MQHPLGTWVAASLAAGTLLLTCGCSRPAPAEGDGAASSAVASAAPKVPPPPPGKALDTPECVACAKAHCPGPVGKEAEVCTGGLCDEWRRCITSRGCINEKGDVRPCYCGETNVEACYDPEAKAPDGRCRAEAEKLSGKSKPFEVGLAWFDYSKPFGIVNQRLECTATACSTPCYPK